MDAGKETSFFKSNAKLSAPTTFGNYRRQVDKYGQIEIRPLNITTMASSNPPGSRETTSTTKLSPGSMEHWTAALINEQGERLPRHLVAYAVGAAFPFEHLRHIAEAICSPEMLERNRDNYLAAFLFHLIDTGLKQTLLHIYHRGTRKHYILWVHSVTPGLPGEKLSHQPISDASWYKFLGYLKKRGVNEEVRSSMKMCCTQWPKGAACACSFLLCL